MKKKLEADLISIAHRILKLKNKSDINQLYLETQKLYEKLAVLKFAEEHFDDLKPTIGYNEIASQVEAAYEKEEHHFPEVIEVEETTPIAVEQPQIETETVTEPEIIEETPEIISEQQETIIEAPTTIIEEISNIIDEPIFEIKKETESTEELSFRTTSDLKPIPDFKPAFELENEEPKFETVAKPNTDQILFEDFGINYADAQFVKVDSFENVLPTPTPSINDFKEKKEFIETVIAEPVKSKTVPLNEKLAKGFYIDLNDRIAFTKNLFGNNTEDYSRVLNQLLTFDSFSEAKEFIETMVKPDYNDWEGKDDYAERFLEAVEKKFS